MKLLADSAYDSRKNFNLLSAPGIIPAIKPRQVKYSSKGLEGAEGEKKTWNKSKRKHGKEKKNVIEYSLSPNSWKKKVGYGKRWAAEIFFLSFKRIFGEHVKARKFENMVNELRIKAALYNSFISL